MFESLFKKPQGYWAKDNHSTTNTSSMGFEVAGFFMHLEDIQKLASKIKKFDMPAKRIIEIGYANKKIYKYYYKNEPVELVPEPTNRVDPNAIMVMISGVHVGYVPREMTQEVASYITAPYLVTAKITGGEYRIVMTEDNDNKYGEPLSITIRLRR